MNAFVSYLKGVDKEGNKKAVAEMVGYMAGMEIDAELAPFAAALAKAWIYEQHPELSTVRMSSGELRFHRPERLRGRHCRRTSWPRSTLCSPS